MIMRAFAADEATALPAPGLRQGGCRRSAAFASAASLIFIFVDEIMAVSLCFYFASPTTTTTMMMLMVMMMKLALPALTSELF